MVMSPRAGLVALRSALGFICSGRPAGGTLQNLLVLANFEGVALLPPLNRWRQRRWCGRPDRERRSESTPFAGPLLVVIAVTARALDVHRAPRPRLSLVAAPAPPSPAMTQRLLVVSAAQGDPEAFDALVERWLDRLFAVAYRILQDHDAADDATQDALVIAWRDIRGLRDPDRFEPWIHRLLVRVCYRHAVRRRRDAVHLIDVDGIEVGRPDSTNAVADRDRLERAFQRLTLQQRTVLVLHHYFGRSHADIGDILQLPEGTVASRLHYALKALRAALAADERPGRLAR